MMIKPTKTERQSIRAVVYGTENASIGLARNPDDTWVIDIHGILVEGGTPGELLREVADILEEA